MKRQNLKLNKVDQFKNLIFAVMLTSKTSHVI